MRIVPALALILSAAAGVAAAQSPPPLSPPPASLSHQGYAARLSELKAQQDAAQRQALFEQQRLNSVESQIRTDQSVSHVQAQTRRPELAEPPPGAPVVTVDPGQYATIPDSALAASNARARAAAEGRR